MRAGHDKCSFHGSLKERYSKEEIDSLIRKLLTEKYLSEESHNLRVARVHNMIVMYVKLGPKSFALLNDRSIRVTLPFLCKSTVTNATPSTSRSNAPNGGAEVYSKYMYNQTASNTTTNTAYASKRAANATTGRKKAFSAKTNSNGFISAPKKSKQPSKNYKRY